MFRPKVEIRLLISLSLRNTSLSFSPTLLVVISAILSPAMDLY